MNLQPRHPLPSLDTQTFSLLLSAILANTLMWAAASALGALEPEPHMAVAAVPSQLQCARL
jgi:hypothetical protein